MAIVIRTPENKELTTASATHELKEYVWSVIQQIITHSQRITESIAVNTTKGRTVFCMLKYKTQTTT